jgi:predicted RNase H-like nuclease
LQRQLVLFLEGVDLPNPMRSLEEITRHHLLRGELPLRDVFPEEHLDALLAAYTALLVGTATERVVQVGDREEGFITLPTADLKSFYP